MLSSGQPKPTQPFEEGIILFPFYRLKIMRHREGKQLAQDHTLSEMYNWDLNTGILAPGPSFLISTSTAFY